jgi:serine protease Do/serine protease DegQ
VEVTLDEFAEKPDELFAGVNVKTLGNDDRRRLQLGSRVTGLIVTGVDEYSPFRDRLAPNAVIIDINLAPVADIASAKQLLRKGRNTLLVYYRGAARFVVIDTSKKN